MPARTILRGLACGLSAWVVTAAHADQIVVNVENAPPGKKLEVVAPAFGGAPVQGTTDAMGKLQLLLTVGNRG